MVQTGMNEKRSKTWHLVLSLLIAISFWVYVDTVEGNTITNTFRNITVEFIGETDTLPSRGLMLAQSGDVEVDLELRGLRSVISGLSSSDLRIQVDLSNITAVGTYPLSYRLLLPDNVSQSSVIIEKASVSTVTVRVVELCEKTIPVTVNVIGEVAEGYIYMEEKLVAQPSGITISGREEDVDPIEEAYIEIDLTGASASRSMMYTYLFRDQNGDVIDDPGAVRVSDKRVQVTAPIYEIRTVPLVVRFSEAPGSTLDHVEWELSVESIEIAGEAANLKNLTELHLGVIYLSDLLSDTEIELDINIPAGCVNLSGETSTILSIRFTDLETRAFTVTDISVVGLIEGKTFSRVTNSVDVVVRGPAEDLELLTAENILIIVDLSKYSYSGTFSIPVTVLVDGFSRIGSVGSYSIACRIS